MLLLSPLALLLAIPAVCGNPLPTTLAPLVSPVSPPASRAQLAAIEDSYIVVLKQGVHVPSHKAKLAQLHAESLPTFSGIKHHLNIGKLSAYAGSFSTHVIDALRAMPEVDFIERDSVVTTQEVERGAPWVSPHSHPILALSLTAWTTQGLARISHRKPLSFGTYNRYDYDSIAGEGVDAYVIDTGVNIDHVELQGRAKWGKTIPQDADKDLNGHGSHVAGTIASAKYGVAKRANIIAVKVLGAGGSGSMSDVVAGVAWAAEAASKAMADKKAGKNPKHKGSVANMSLGGGASKALDQGSSLIPPISRIDVADCHVRHSRRRCRRGRTPLCRSRRKRQQGCLVRRLALVQLLSLTRITVATTLPPHRRMPSVSERARLETNELTSPTTVNASTLWLLDSTYAPSLSLLGC